MTSLAGFCVGLLVYAFVGNGWYGWIFGLSSALAAFLTASAAHSLNQRFGSRENARGSNDDGWIDDILDADDT
ncbi:MAG: hypothetical protein AAGJ87_06910 [Pseudomonadota bacterium]